MHLPQEDHFAAFALAPRPSIDLDDLRERFARLSAELHPDKSQNAPPEERDAIARRYTDLTRAYQILREPRERLLHLYEREKGSRPSDVQRIPPGTMDLFVEVGQLCQTIDGHLKSRAAASTALERASAMVAGLEAQERVVTLQQSLSRHAASLDAELATLDAAWVAGERKLEALETLYRKYSYVWRWQQQLEERLVALMTEG